MILLAFLQKTKSIRIRIEHILALIALVIGIVLVLFALWFMIDRDRVIAPGGEVNTNFPVKEYVTCEVFEQHRDQTRFPEINTLEYDISRVIPQDFPEMPPHTLLCGVDPHLDSAFYITDLGNDEILNYYRLEFDNQGYEVSDLYPGEHGGDILMNVSHESGLGSLYVFSDKNIYVLSFTATENLGDQ